MYFDSILKPSGSTGLLEAHSFSQKLEYLAFKGVYGSLLFL